MGFEVSFYLKNENNHLACDSCEGEEEPLCLKYCNQLMYSQLKTFLERKVFKALLFVENTK